MRSKLLQRRLGDSSPKPRLWTPKAHGSGAKAATRKRTTAENKELNTQKPGKVENEVVEKLKIGKMEN